MVLLCKIFYVVIFDAAQHIECTKMNVKKKKNIYIVAISTDRKSRA